MEGHKEYALPSGNKVILKDDEAWVLRRPIDIGLDKMKYKQVDAEVLANIAGVERTEVLLTVKEIGASHDLIDHGKGGFFRWKYLESYLKMRGYKERDTLLKSIAEEIAEAQANPDATLPPRQPRSDQRITVLFEKFEHLDEQVLVWERQLAQLGAEDRRTRELLALAEKNREAGDEHTRKLLDALAGEVLDLRKQLAAMRQ